MQTSTWTLSRTDGATIDPGFPAIDLMEAARCVRQWYGLYAPKGTDLFGVHAQLRARDGQTYELRQTR